MTLAPHRRGTGSAGPTAAGRRYVDIGDLTTESGVILPGVTLAYESWGTLNSRGDNAIVVLHALTGDSHVVGDPGADQPTPGWWNGLIGAGAPLDPERHFVIAANVLGGCRGSTGPSSIAPDGKPYGSRFPRVTPRDQVAAEHALLQQLGVTSVVAVIGGSMGGMRALEWGVMYPELVQHVVPIATCAVSSGDQIAWSAPQLAAIRSDHLFRGGDYYPQCGGDGPPAAGLEIARQIAHITYRSAIELDTRFGRDPQAAENPADGGRYAVQSYLDYHGRKLAGRFDPNSYLVLTESMNLHDIGRGRGGVAAALRRITGEITVAVVDTDRLFPPAQGAEIATAPTARPLITLRSDHGHDGFLIEAEQIAAVIRSAVG